MELGILMLIATPKETIPTGLRFNDCDVAQDVLRYQWQKGRFVVQIDIVCYDGMWTGGISIMAVNAGVGSPVGRPTRMCDQAEKYPYGTIGFPTFADALAHYVTLARKWIKNNTAKELYPWVTQSAALTEKDFVETRNIYGRL